VRRWIDPVRHLDYWWPAANSNPTQIPLKTFEIDPRLDNDIWREAMGAGRLAWINSSAPVTFSISSTAVNRVIAEPLEHREYFGQMRGQVSGNTLISFGIELNETMITYHVERNNYNLSNVIQSIMAHELGHTIGLKGGFMGSPHTGIANASLMNHDRNRNVVTGPLAFDIESVKMIYD